MDKRTRLFLILAAITGVGAWIWFTQTGRAIAQSAGSAVATGVRRLADISDSTLQLIKGFESFSSTAYPDARGWSIGYGHFMGSQPTMQTISEPDAYDLLKSDVSEAANAVKLYVSSGVNLTQNMFDALTSFAYNVGINAFKNSTLLKKLNAGDVQGAAEEFDRWIYASGKPSDALIARRGDEKSLFLSA